MRATHVISDDDGAQRRVIRRHLLVVDGPEAVKCKCLLVPGDRWLHTLVGHVPDAVVDEVEADGSDGVGHGISRGRDGDEAGKKNASERGRALHKCVDSIAVRGDRRRDHAVDLDGLGDAARAALDGVLVDSARVRHGEGDILNAITVSPEVRDRVTAEQRDAGSVRRRENERDAALPYDMRRDRARARLKAAGGDARKSHPSDEPVGSEPRVADEPVHMVEVEEFAWR